MVTILRLMLGIYRETDPSKLAQERRGLAWLLNGQYVSAECRHRLARLV